MNFKKVLIIGLLSISIVGLIAFGIKTGSFNNENTKPKTLTQHRNAPIRTDAEGEITPISLNWLLNEELTFTGDTFSNIRFTTTYKGVLNSTREINTTTIFTGIRSLTTGGHQTLQLFNNQWNEWQSIYFFEENKWTRYYNEEFNQINSTNNTRVLKFEQAPSGNLYTWLTENAQPIYNNSVCIENSTTSIYQIDKNDIYLPNPSVFKSPGQINVYLYAGITQLYVNDTQITNFSSTITITNDNIAIKILGTPDLNTVAYHLIIIFYNDLPDIAPTPIPDPTTPTYEIVDIRSIMLTILTMPFSFITQAFNVTLWQGTPYQFNLSSFIMAIIGILAVLFIIKLFTSGFSIVGNYTSNIRKNNDARQSLKRSRIAEKTAQAEKNAKVTKNE